MPPKKNIIYGKHPIVEALQSGKSIEKVFIQKGIAKDFEKELRKLCTEHEVAFQFVPKEKLNRLCRNNHQGAVALISLIEYSQLDDVIPFIYEKSESPLFLILDGITDVRNFGAIARSAELLGVHALIIPEKGGAAVNQDAIKTSAGALNRLHVCREKSLKKVIRNFQLNGIHVAASALNEDKMIGDCDFSVPLAIVMGSEDKGVSNALLKEVDSVFMIPQKGKIDSFNVSVAAGIVLYEVMKQRG